MDNIKKMTNFAAGGLLFGLTAGLVIVVMLSLFPPAERKAEPADAAGETAKEEPQIGEPDADGAKEQSAPAAIKEADNSNADKTVVTDVTDVVDRVMPCVVSIFSTYVIEESFWGYHYDYEAEGGGSGIIIGENETELLIVTNNHVVEDSKELSVQFIDESVATADIKGTDSVNDLAVIAVDLSRLDSRTAEAIRIATLGDSQTLKVGEPAIAIGNALGYGQSVTVGVISAVNRMYSEDAFYGYGTQEQPEDARALIQTDAAINPGNSGGALLNVRGEVIGINSNKIVGVVTEGMGYAIPISTAKPIMEELMQRTTLPVKPETDKGAYLGVSGAPVTSDIKERFDIDKGLYITQVFSDTPAKEAGIRKGDVLLAIDDREIANVNRLQEVLAFYEEGSEVKITLLKRSNSGYREENITVVLGGKE